VPRKLDVIAQGSELEIKGVVYDIQKYTLNDGPGIRTMVFLKGCPLRCLWCSNPESQVQEIQLSHSAALCKRCYACLSICRFNALSKDEYFAIKIDDSKCTRCLDCLAVCPAGALQVMGKEATVSEVMAEISGDRIFYRKSHGGVTISGGEPFHQYGFLRSLLHVLHSKYIHTAIETTGSVEWEKIEQLLPDLDLILYDLKTTDSNLHREYTGRDNALILENLEKLDRFSTPIWLRVPVVPGLNDDDQNIMKIGEIAANSRNVRKICLLPYHKLGIHKYLRLGMSYQLSGVEPPSPETLSRLESLLKTQAPALEIQISG
jgi:pyruvate formate lyase activating enzyme